MKLNNQIPNHVIKAADKSFKASKLLDVYRRFFIKAFYSGYKYGSSHTKLRIAYSNYKRNKVEESLNTKQIVYHYYVFDYSTPGIYKIKLTRSQIESIRQKLIDRGYLNKDNEIKDGDVLYYFGFKESNCSWMVYPENLDIQEIKEPIN